MKTIDISKEAFNTKQVSQIIKDTTRKIRYWDQKGLVKPSISPASGKGSKRLYSYVDLLALTMVKALRDQGASLQKIGRCVGFLRKHLPDISQPLTFCRLVTLGEAIYLVQDEETLIDTVKRQGQQAFLQINVAAQDQELRKQILQLTTKRIEEVVVGEYAYQVEIEADVEEGGYVAEVAGLPGCITDGDTLDAVLDMAKDAIRGWLDAHEDMKRRGIDVPLEKPKQRRKKA